MQAWSRFVMPAHYCRKEPLSPLYGSSQSVLLLHPHSYVLYLKLSGRFHAHVELSRSVWLPWSSLKIPAWFLHLEYALFPFLCHKPDSPDESTMSVHHLSLWMLQDHSKIHSYQLLLQYHRSVQRLSWKVRHNQD